MDIEKFYNTYIEFEKLVKQYFYKYIHKNAMGIHGTIEFKGWRFIDKDRILISYVNIFNPTYEIMEKYNVSQILNGYDN